MVRIVLVMMLLSTLAFAQPIPGPFIAIGPTAAAVSVPVFDAASQEIGYASSAIKTWVHAVTGANPYIFVGTTGGTTCDSAYVGTTKMVELETNIYNAYTYLFGVKNPATGIDTIKVYYHAACYAVSCAASYTNVNQTTPLGTVVKSTGLTNGAVSTVISCAGTMDLGIMLLGDDDLGATTFTATAPGVKKSFAEAGSYRAGIMQQVGAVGNTTLAGTISSAISWQTISVSLKPL